MTKLYTVLPEEALPKYRVLFSLLADPSNLPLLFCCSAGKDRTGVAAALILYALGAGMDTIMEDYLYSTENLRPYWERFQKSQPCLIPYYTVTEKYLLAAFKSMEQYGGINSYITKELGVDLNHLRELYTE
jgi:protein-tyrosine phosphatase